MEGSSISEALNNGRMRPIFERIRRDGRVDPGTCKRLQHEHECTRETEAAIYDIFCNSTGFPPEDVQLRSCVSLVSLPECPKQQLHRDYTEYLEDEMIQDGVEALYSCLMAIDTRRVCIIPNSHTITDFEDDLHEHCVQVVLQPGETLIFDGRLIHSGDENSEGIPLRAIHWYILAGKGQKWKEKKYNMDQTQVV